MSVSCGTGGFRLSIAPQGLVVGPLPRTVRCSTCGERGFEFLPISKEPPPCRLPASSEACPLRGIGDRTRATLAIVATARGGGGDQAFLPACNGPGGVGMELWPSWCWAQMSWWGLLVGWRLELGCAQGRSWAWPIGNDPGTVAGVRVLIGFAVHAESITFSIIASAAARDELTGSSATATCVPDLPSDGDCTGVAGGALARGGEPHAVILRMKSSSCS